MVIFNITSNQFKPEDLKNKLEKSISFFSSQIKIISEKETTDLRSIDPIVVKAICALSGTVIGALIKSLLDLSKSKILIEIQNNDDKIKIETPVNCSPQKIEQLINIIKKENAVKVKLE